MNRFGGRFKYSKILQLIDRVDNAITSNITKVKIRRDMKVLIGQFAQYEICFGNRFNVKPNGLNIKSTGFKLSGESSVVYFTDVPNANLMKGVISVVKINSNGEKVIVARDAGIVDYMKGEVILNTLNIVETDRPVSYTHLTLPTILLV